MLTWVNNIGPKKGHDTDDRIAASFSSLHSRGKARRHPIHCCGMMDSAYPRNDVALNLPINVPEVVKQESLLEYTPPMCRASHGDWEDDELLLARMSWGGADSGGPSVAGWIERTGSAATPLWCSASALLL